MVQVTALLMMTLKDVGPTFEGLLGLSFSLGITVISQNQYYYEDSELPTHIHPLLKVANSFSLVNIFLVVLFGPLLVGVVVKIVHKKILKSNPHKKKRKKKKHF